MATASPLEDHITCVVCYNVYDDPHELTQCLHTFCLSCIQSVEKQGNVKCPECREVTNITDLKKDFKTQKLVDAYKNQLESIKITSTTCGMCENAINKIIFLCIECQHLMCLTCNEVHQRMKLSKFHTVKPVDDMVRNSGAECTSFIEKCKIQQNSFDKISQQLDTHIDEINHNESKQLEKVKENTDNIIDELRKWQSKQEERIRDRNTSLAQQLTEQKKEVVRNEEQIKKNIDLLSGKIKCIDLSILLDSAQNEMETIKKSTKDIDIALSDFKSIAITPVTVNKNTDWSVENSLEVKGGEIKHVKCGTKPLPTLKYLSLYGGYKQSGSVMVDRPQQLCQVSNEIWCLNDVIGIVVFDKDCNQVKVIDHDKLKNECGFTKTHNNEVAIACYDNNGLQLLDDAGNYKAEILKGSFADVSAYGELLYAFECEKSKVIVCGYRNYRWQAFRHINVDFRCHFDDKICVKRTGIYISSWLDKCIHVYSLEGEFKEKITYSPAIQVVDVDNEGNILVADFNDDQLKICSRRSGCYSDDWSLFPVPQGRGYQSYALVDDQHNIWLAEEVNVKKYSASRF